MMRLNIYIYIYEAFETIRTVHKSNHNLENIVLYRHCCFVCFYSMSEALKLT